MVSSTEHRWTKTCFIFELTTILFIIYLFIIDFRETGREGEIERDKH